MTTSHQAALATDDLATEHITPHLAPDSALSLEKWSLEVLPRDATDLSPVPNAIGEIYVSMIPGETVESVIKALKRIRAQGKTPVPHIAARHLESDKALRSVLIACATLDVHRVLLIGGGATQVTGPYAEVMDLLKTGLLADYGITHIDIAGHPEGNPDDPDPEQSLIAKLNWADTHGMHSRILTQWSFDAPAVNSWIERLRALGFKQPVHVGIPGPATLKALLRYATVCGVKTSSQVLKRQGLSLGRLLLINKPDRLISDLRGYDQLHLFPFGGLARTTEWLKQR